MRYSTVHVKPPTEGKDLLKKEDETIREPESKSQAQQWMEGLAGTIWQNLNKNHLWERMVKNILATTLAVIIAMIPAVVDVYGRATYLAPMTTVFGHPGRRFGKMAEALILALIGSMVGTAWSTLGIYLSSLVYQNDEAAAYTIRAVFLAVIVLLHGFLRSHSPRLFIGVLLMIIVSIVSLTSTTNEVSGALITTLLYPIITAIGILLLVNICVFPEFSSSFLGATTIETLGETVEALRNAGEYFIFVKSSNEVKTRTEVSEENIIREALTVMEEPAGATRGKCFLSSSIYKLIKLCRGEGARQKGSRDPPAKTPEKITLKSLLDKKSKLRLKLSSCKEAQQECNFELAFAVLPPRDLKPISDTAMKELVANTIALIGACETKYALVGNEEVLDENPQAKREHTSVALKCDADRGKSLREESSTDNGNEVEKEDREIYQKRSKGKTREEKEVAELELIKPSKEIESGDAELLRLLVKGVSNPIMVLQGHIDKSMDVVISCLAYCYDVPSLPNGARPPKGIRLEEMDIWAGGLVSAVVDFDRESTVALERLSALHSHSNLQVDIMPRMETFLISSFLLNLRQAALRTHEMLVHSRKLLEKWQSRQGRRRLFAPRIHWRKWLTSGGEDDLQALPAKGRKEARTGTMDETVDDDTDTTPNEENVALERGDEEAWGKKNKSGGAEPTQLGSSTKKRKTIYRSRTGRARYFLANLVESAKASDDMIYALKLTIALFFVIWPAFLSNWATWFYLNRGLWAAMQLVLVAEVAIGSSVAVFMLRGVGTTLGCLWGLAAFETGSGDRVICIIMLIIGIVPSVYVQLGTKYVKAGMVSIVSMCVVALATEDQTVPGTATENFLKRWIAFLIGGCVAIVIEVVLYPVKARDRLVESLATSIRQISEMEACLAYGIETEINVDVHSHQASERFDKAKSKAQVALSAAETFLPFCSQEPRVKGSFAGLALVYTEILYVLHQIVDKMESMQQLRREYGSRVLEELNARVFQYRRNVAGSITLVLFAVHEALTTKLPLPQFLPSARLAHLRMVNRVREVVFDKVMEVDKGASLKADQHPILPVEPSLVERIIEKRFLSWSAATASQTEVIEYLEELIDLTKLLVGANEFRSGMLTRPTYREYLTRVENKNSDPRNISDRQDTGRHDLQLDREQKDFRDAPARIQKFGSVRRSIQGAVSGAVEVISLKGAWGAGQQKKQQDSELPGPLQRVRTRRLETIASQQR